MASQETDRVGGGELLDKLDALLVQWRDASAGSLQQVTGRIGGLKENVEGLAKDAISYEQTTSAFAGAVGEAVERLRATAGDALKSAKRVEELERALNERESAMAEARAQAVQAAERAKELEGALSAAEKRVARLEEMLSEASRATEAAKERAEGLERSLAEKDKSAQQGTSELEQRVAAANEAVAAHEKRTTELELALKEKDGALSSLRREATAAREDFERQLEAERQRADDSERKLEQETARGTKAVLAQQLAQALADAERAQQELREVKGEVQRAGGRAGAEPGVSEGIEEPVEPAAAEAAPEPEPKPVKKAARRRAKRASLGEILVTSGAITSEQFELAVQEQKQSPQRNLVMVLIEKGLAGEDAIARALADHCGLDLVGLQKGKVDAAAAFLISSRLASLHTCIPLRATQDTVTLAMANPLDLVAIEDVERATQRRVEAVVASASEIVESIQSVYASA